MTVPAIRERMVASLANASAELAEGVAGGLGMKLPKPLPRATKSRIKPEITVSPPHSLTAHPGDGGIRTRKVAILVADGADPASVEAVKTALLLGGAIPRLLGVRIVAIRTADGKVLEADASLENSPSVLFDAVVLPDGKNAVQALRADGRTLEFVKDQYRHCKSILALGASCAILQRCGIAATLPGGAADPGLILAGGGQAAAAVKKFVAAVGRYRHPERDTDPPLI